MGASHALDPGSSPGSGTYFLLHKMSNVLAVFLLEVPCKHSRE